MRRLILSLTATTLMGLGPIVAANAAPVPGFESFYTAVFTNCTLPNGTLQTCESAINAYAGAVVAADIDIAEANASFTALRAEVFAANAPDPEFQADIDALFELLLPDSGAIGGPADPVSPA